MEESQTISWILLATALASRVNPADFRGITQIADGINHAVPTQKELQTSIKWLMAKSFLAKSGNKYSLTESGNSLVNKAESGSPYMLTIWGLLDKEISILL